MQPQDIFLAGLWSHRRCFFFFWMQKKRVLNGFLEINRAKANYWQRSRHFSQSIHRPKWGKGTKKHQRIVHDCAICEKGATNPKYADISMHIHFAQSTIHSTYALWVYFAQRLGRNRTKLSIWKEKNDDSFILSSWCFLLSSWPCLRAKRAAKRIKCIYTNIMQNSFSIPIFFQLVPDTSRWK